MQDPLCGFCKAYIHDKEDREVMQTENAYLRVQKIAGLIRKGIPTDEELEHTRSVQAMLRAAEIKRLEGQVSRKRGPRRAR